MFDSFAGLPPANFEKDGEKALELTGDCCGSPADVQEIMRAVVYPEGLVYCYPGWFNETLHLWPPGKIALLRLDADWYESTKICLDVLYQHIVPGGLLVIDDYFCWPGCRAAVDEYFENTNQAMIRYDDSKVLEGTTDSYVPATFIKEGRVGQRRNS
jgi:hypothetical protein